MKKMFWGLIILLTCCVPKTSREPVTIRIGAFSSLYHPLKKIGNSNEFKAHFPGVTLDVQAVNFFIPYDNYKIEESYFQDRGNHIWMISQEALSFFVASDDLADLNSYPYFAHRECASLLPAALAAGTTTEGRGLGVPLTIQGILLFYRISTLMNAGIDPGTIKTWDDLFAGIVSIGADRNGDNMADAVSLIEAQEIAAAALEGGMINLVSGEMPFVPTLKYLSIFKQIYKLEKLKENHSYHFLIKSPEANIEAGKLGFALIGNSTSFNPTPFLLEGLKGDVGVMIPPGFSDTGSPSYARASTIFLCLPRDVPESLRPLAWKIMKFLTMNKEAQQTLTKEGAFFPVYTPLYDDQEFTYKEFGHFFGIDPERIKEIKKEIFFHLPSRNISLYDHIAYKALRRAVIQATEGWEPDDILAQARISVQNQMLLSQE